ncbi:MAG TPA: pseudouridine synthase [Caulobacteraceae bacterium]|nr:pseudouridine synthase [Caulobacteraceae bacterium]
MIRHSKDPSPPKGPGQDNSQDDASGAAASGTPGGDRVAKALARAGVASRREVERLIEAGRVALNGKVLTGPAVKVAPGDILTLDGNVVSDAEPTRLWRYHKPVGLVTTHKDPNGRPTVFEHLPEGLPRVISIGRLDVNSEGLLLLTNDGGLARALELPSTGWVRRYRARARGRASQAALDKLKDGVTVEGVRYGSVEAKLDKAKESPDGKAPANLWVSVAVAEGKNREVRRVLESVGLQVNRLMRLSYGPFQLGTLLPGEVEEVGPRVIREQLEGLVAPENMPKGDRTVAPPKSKASSTQRRAPGAAGGPTGAGRKPKPADAEAKPKPKPVYKAGWARPKPKAAFKGGPAKPKAGPAHIAGRPAAADARAKAKAKRPGPRRPSKG